MSDLCEYCEEGRSLKKNIIELVKNENYQFDNPLQINSLLEYFLKKKNEENLDALEIERHKVIEN